MGNTAQQQGKFADDVKRRTTLKFVAKLVKYGK
jgi:hypothetical protein